MAKMQTMTYRGRSRDVQYAPWMRLVNGRKYDIQATQRGSGRIRAKISDGLNEMSEFYKDEYDFTREWC